MEEFLKCVKLLSSKLGTKLIYYNVVLGYCYFQPYRLKQTDPFIYLSIYNTKWNMKNHNAQTTAHKALQNSDSCEKDTNQVELPPVPQFTSWRVSGQSSRKDRRTSRKENWTENSSREFRGIFQLYEYHCEETSQKSGEIEKWKGNLWKKNGFETIQLQYVCGQGRRHLNPFHIIHKLIFK